MTQPAQIPQRVRPIPSVLDLNAEVLLVPSELLRQEDGVLVVSRLTADLDGCFEIEGKLSFGTSSLGGSDEGVEASDVGGFGVAVEEEGGVIRVGESGGVEFLEVGGEVVDSLSVEELRTDEEESISSMLNLLS